MPSRRTNYAAIANQFERAAFERENRQLRLAPCACRNCSDGVCGVETLRREASGKPVCEACARGEHRVRAD